MTEQDAADTDVDEDAGAETDPVDGPETAAEAAPTGGENGFEDLVEPGAADVEVDDELVERVAESDPEAVARELAGLRVRVDGLAEQLDEREAELDDLTEQLKRKQADFENYKKRVEKRREQEKRRATEDLVERLTGVRDNLLRALDHEDADAEAVRDGVESTLRQFDRVLEDENVDVVEPEPGDEVDPHTHEVLMRVDSDQPEDTVADVHRPGYVMADKVLQTAQVTVSTGPGDQSDAENRSGDGGDE